MITKELFVKFLEQYQRFNTAFERIEEALMGKKYSSNLYESDWVDSVGDMLDIFLESHFTECGCDLINWWLFEHDDWGLILYEKEERNLFNEEKKTEIIIETLDELYNYLIKHKEDYFLE